MTLIIDDIANYLSVNGIGTIGTNLFEDIMPPTPDDAVVVSENVGSKPSIYLPTKYPSFQVLIRSRSFDVGRAVTDNIRTLLHNKYNLQFTNGGNYFYYCRLITEGGHIGHDSLNRVMFSLNFECYTR